MRIALFYDNFVRDFRSLLLLSRILEELGHETFLEPLWNDAKGKIHFRRPDLVLMGQIGEYTTGVIGKYVYDCGIPLVLNSTESGGTDESIKNFFKFNYSESNEKYITLQSIANKREYDYVMSSGDVRDKTKYKWIGFPRYDFNRSSILRDVEIQTIKDRYHLQGRERIFLYLSSFIFDGSGDQVSPENRDHVDLGFRERLDSYERHFTEEVLSRLVDSFRGTENVLLVKKHPWEKGKRWERRFGGDPQVVIVDEAENIVPLLRVCDFAMHLRSTAAIEAWYQGVKTISVFPKHDSRSRALWFHHLDYETIASTFDELQCVIHKYPNGAPGKNYLESFYAPFVDDKATIRLAHEIHRCRDLVKSMPMKGFVYLNGLVSGCRKKLTNIFQRSRARKGVSETASSVINIGNDGYAQKLRAFEAHRPAVECMYRDAINKYIEDHYISITHV